MFQSDLPRVSGNLIEELKKKLKPEQIQKANKVIGLLDKKYKITFERAGDQKQIVFDSDQDPYLGIISADPKSQAQITTDGKLEYHEVFAMPSGHMRRYTVSNYEYIVIKQDFPGKKPGTISSKYQSVMVKSKDLKFYIQHLLKLPPS